MEKPTILFTIHYLDDCYPMQVSLGQYHSLMALICDSLAIPGFGLCCGMGSCGTCLVQIKGQHSVIRRNVLACDILINDAIANTDIFIPANMY